MLASNQCCGFQANDSAHHARDLVVPEKLNTKYDSSIDEMSYDFLFKNYYEDIWKWVNCQLTK